jgi:hypothetical protein
VSTDGWRRVLDVEEPGNGARFSPDGRRVAVMRDREVVVREVGTGQALGTPIRDSNSFVLWVEWDPSGTLLAVSSEAGVQVVDVRSGARIGPLLSWVPGTMAGFAPDGLVVDGPAGVVTLPLDPEVWVDAACRAAGSNLSHREWGRYLGVSAYRPTCAGLPRRDDS